MLAAAMGSLLVTAAVLVALVLTGGADDVEGPLALFVSPLLILVAPVVVALVVLAVSFLRRERGPSVSPAHSSATARLLA